MSYEVRLTPTAVRDLKRISPRYVDAMLAFVYGPLAENPQRVGKEIQREVSGLHSARRGSYRILYEIRDDHDRSVLVYRVDHRAHVYRNR